MKFIFFRDKTVASTSGHTIGFKKGEPTHVPPEAIKDVIAAGGVPEDEEFDPDPKPEGVIEPSDPVERQAAIFKAFETIVKRGRREDHTAGGTPHQKALAAELGWPLQAKERDAAWVAFNNIGKSE